MLGFVGEEKAASVGFLIFRIINNDFGKITKNGPDQIPEDWLVLGFHRRAWVDFDKPNFELFIYHKIITKELKALFPIIHHILYT